MLTIDFLALLKIAAAVLALGILALSPVSCFKNARSRRKRNDKKKGKKSKGSPSTSDEDEKGSVKDGKRCREKIMGSFETFTLGGPSVKDTRNVQKLKAPEPIGPTNPKEAQIIGGLVRNKTDYPTMEDVISDWDEPGPVNNINKKKR